MFYKLVEVPHKSGGRVWFCPPAVFGQIAGPGLGEMSEKGPRFIYGSCQTGRVWSCCRMASALTMVGLHHSHNTQVLETCDHCHTLTPSIVLARARGFFIPARPSPKSATTCRTVAVASVKGFIRTGAMRCMAANGVRFYVTTART